MDGRCGTCKHWWQWDKETEFYADQGYCERARKAWVTVEDPLASSQSDGVLTHRTFGCILWEKPE